MRMRILNTIATNTDTNNTNTHAISLGVFWAVFQALGPGVCALRILGDHIPKGSMYLYSRYLSLKGVPI